MYETKVVKIYPKEYWDLTNGYGGATVNGKDFYPGLDLGGNMQSYFGKIVTITKKEKHDNHYRIKGDKYFCNWSPEAFQEVYKQEEYPEYYI